MRKLIILLFAFLSWNLAVASTPETTLAKTLDSLSSTQRALLYQYGTLQSWAGAPVADSFWNSHQSELGRLNKESAALLAQELLHNTDLVYTVKKPSRLQALRGVFTTSRLLYGLAALIGAFAAIQLLGKYLPDFFRWIVRYLSPLFRWLFSPIALTWELLLLGIAGIFLGPYITETYTRTIIIHLGIFYIWSQLTAITTRQYHLKYYSKSIWDSIDNYRLSPWQTFLQVSFPAFATTAGILWVMRATGDKWYPYEVIVPLMIGIYALPPLRRMELLLSRVLFPFAQVNLRLKDQRLAAFVVICLIVWEVMLFLPVIIPEALLVLSVFLLLMLILFSIEDVSNCGMKNFIWLQVITLSFCIAVILVSSQLSMLVLSWAGMGGLLLYVMIKYWELPTLFGWSWKNRNRKAWGALGMAALIWGIATLIRMHPEWFTVFPA
ncbi:MAG: hypothetical protein JO154_01890 [Chitinophaga sp.]|uniref:hypothetical protein n=1 Tax=Chitinophaga sp. TaxID=1869181 RepID=UPI0025BB75C3|nr:hypothetical protein [Chitinophaga sp.]MBV8251331.1 hypothetical protein [Chitinophaga sp.]